MTNSDRNEITSIIKDEIKKFHKDTLDMEIKKILAKSNGKARGEVVNLVKNAMEAVYKVLWQKRDFWKTDIK
jgi:hypothetical protein